MKLLFNVSSIFYCISIIIILHIIVYSDFICIYSSGTERVVKFLNTVRLQSSSFSQYSQIQCLRWVIVHLGFMFHFK
jgi:hypothetical protein